MLFFRRRPHEEKTTSAGAARISPSKVLAGLQRFVDLRTSDDGAARVLLCGPPSGPTIEAFSAAGCRVTVEGEESPSLKLDYPDHSFDLVLGFDVLDFLGDDDAVTLAREWSRVLRPGGRVYLLARRESSEAAERLRFHVRNDGRLEIARWGVLPAPVRARSNRRLESVLAPLLLDEIFLRRDGLRELGVRRR